MSTKETGTVKWFSDKKGFGFIENQQGQDVFLHYRDIIGDGYKRARDGDPVKYLKTSTDKGLAAKEVEVMESNWPLEETYSELKSNPLA